MLKQNRKKF